jgi:uncharacterized membrane protein YdbT with pleckstrin-like domain
VRADHATGSRIPVRPHPNEEIVVENTPIREIKPVVVPAQFFVWGPLASGFISLFPGFFVFVISNMISRQFEPVVGYGIAVYVTSFIVCMVLIGIKVFQEPSRTSYTVFPDRLEYYEGLWNRHRRTLVFNQVIDVELTEGVLQQTQGAGTVTLVTQQLVSQGEGQLSNRKIAIKNVLNPKEVYELIRSLALKRGAEPS